MYTLLAMLLDSQSIPSSNPSPVVAQVFWMYLQTNKNASSHLLYLPKQYALMPITKQKGKYIFSLTRSNK
jgi:hypothetical protein